MDAPLGLALQGAKAGDAFVLRPICVAYVDGT